MSKLQKYDVLRPLNHNGKKYKPTAKGENTIVEMTPDDAAALIKLGVLSDMKKHAAEKTVQPEESKD